MAIKYKHPSKRYRTFGGKDYKLYAFHDSKAYLKRLQKKFGYGRIVPLAKDNPFGDGKKWGMYVPV